MQEHEDQNVPQQVEGKKLDIVETREFTDKEAAYAAFERAREKLLALNSWHELAGNVSAVFTLKDKFGRPVARMPEVGDYVMIDIPGPSSAYGHGYDWVTIVKLEDRAADDYVMLSLKPSPPPDEKDSNTVAHFFSSHSSTSLIVALTANKLQVSYYGRNETINTDNKAIVDDIRNLFVGFGAKLGLSHPQWKKLVLGILE